MAYNRENYTKLKAEYEEKNIAAKNAADARALKVAMEHSDIAKIDRELSLTSIKILRIATKKSDTSDDFLKLREHVSALREEKTALLKKYGYPEDYCDVKYECPLCSDTGYVGTTMCSCFKRKLVLLGYESSGIGALIRRQSFDNLSFEYYKDSQESLSLMRQNYDIIFRYATSFSSNTTQNLLLMGGTGLGKTHLSSAMAKLIIDRGYDVLYESAPNIFSDFETERFKRDEDDNRSQRYFDAELLIIDDLGVESTTQYTLSCLYNIINTRINSGRPTVISTNLTPNDLIKRYTDRITSRLIGEYMTLRFEGKDIRLQKLR